MGRLCGAAPSQARYEKLEDRERRNVGEAGEGEDDHGVERKVVLHDPGEGGSADRADGAADADDGGDGGGGEHVGWC